MPVVLLVDECASRSEGIAGGGVIGTEKVHAAKGERSMTYDNIGKAMTQNAFAGSSETSFPCSPEKQRTPGVPYYGRISGTQCL